MSTGCISQWSVMSVLQRLKQSIGVRSMILTQSNQMLGFMVVITGFQCPELLVIIRGDVVIIQSVCFV